METTQILEDMIKKPCDCAAGPGVGVFILWLRQRVPTPIATVATNGAGEVTLDTVHRLRDIIGNHEYGLVLKYRDKHMAHGNVAEVAEFNVVYGHFVREEAKQEDTRLVAELWRSLLHLARNMGDRYSKALQHIIMDAHGSRSQDITGIFPLNRDLSVLYKNVVHCLMCLGRGQCRLRSGCVKTLELLRHNRECRVVPCEEFGDQCGALKRFLTHYFSCVRGKTAHTQCPYCVVVLTYEMTGFSWTIKTKSDVVCALAAAARTAPTVSYFTTLFTQAQHQPVFSYAHNEVDIVKPRIVIGSDTFVWVIPPGGRPIPTGCTPGDFVRVPHEPFTQLVKTWQKLKPSRRTVLLNHVLCLEDIV